MLSDFQYCIQLMLKNQANIKTHPKNFNDKYHDFHCTLANCPYTRVTREAHAFCERYIIPRESLACHTRGARVFFFLTFSWTVLYSVHVHVHVHVHHSDQNNVRMKYMYNVYVGF